MKKKYPKLPTIAFIAVLLVAQAKAQSPTPDNIGANANLRAWFDASDLTTLLNPSGAQAVLNDEIKTWKNKAATVATSPVFGSTTTNVSNAIATRYPQLVNGGTFFNNQNALSFDNTASAEDTLGLKLATLDQWTAPYTAFIVYVSNVTQAQLSGFFSTDYSAATANGSWQFSKSATTNDFTWKTGAGGTAVEIIIEPEAVNSLKLYTVTHTGSTLPYTVSAYADGVFKNSFIDPVGTPVKGNKFNAYRFSVNRVTSAYSDCKIAEVILYDKVLDACEMAKVNFYLGKKYGKDFGNSFDYNYGTTGLALNTHPNNIQGIGYITVPCPIQVDVAVSSICTLDNPSSNNTNGESLTMGNDASSLTTIVNAPPGAGFAKRLTRTWAATHVGSVGTVDVSFDLTGLGIDMTKPSNFALLLDNNTDMSDATAYTTGRTVVGNIVKFTGVTVNDATIFSLATDVVAPGAVAGSKVWLKANQGTGASANGDPVTAWVDQASLLSTVTNYGPLYIGAAIQPSWVENSVNYNPAVKYNNGYFTELQNVSPVKVPNSTVIVAGTMSSTPAANGIDINIAWELKPNNAYGFINSRQNFSSPGACYFGSGNVGTQLYDEFDDNTPAFNDCGGLLGPEMPNDDVTFTITGQMLPAPAGGNIIPFQNGLTYPSVAYTPTAGNYYATNQWYYNNFGNDYMEDGTEYGNLNETIIFDYNLSIVELRKVNSYLALKYGTTLDASTINYANSTGTNIYNIDATYKNNIIGIERDDATALYQKQSQTKKPGWASDSLRLFVGSLATTNTANTGTITNNLSSVVIGDDGANQNSNPTATMPAGILFRLNKTWKLTNTNFTDPFKVEIILPAGVPLTDLTKLRLICTTTPGTGTPAALDAGSTLIAGGANGITFTAGSIIMSVDPAAVGSPFAAGNTVLFTLGSIAGSTLPVSIISFDAKPNGSKVETKWVVAGEQDIKNYEVQRSANASTNWVTVVSQNSLGNTSGNRNYAATDNTPLIGTGYYRLRINDNDGSYKYSDVKKVTLTAKGLVSITPNPTSGSIIIKAPAGELSSITVINAVGNTVKKFNGNTTSTQMPLDLSNLPKGVYMIKTESTSQKVVLK